MMDEAKGLIYYNECRLERIPGLITNIAKTASPSPDLLDEVTNFLIEKCLEIASNYTDIFVDTTRIADNCYALVSRLRYDELRIRLTLAANEFVAKKIQAHG